MQTERVTFLTTPDHKAALDAFARGSGQSVGHVLREASSRYVADSEMGEEESFKLLVRELNEALPAMHAALDDAIAGQQQLRAEVDTLMRDAGLRA
ncbi:hypothetical protein [Sphingomonas solaris]|uniref:CopG family transcriptional regulator n=1 Tax=Alterirhizorhabdus solaris TaxID=2529389 RepID=A0A558RCY4_9SPHN|nr:hypothetical protein [Sphingomonas solaris]TVV77218.1 hypothetical protein FOY91_01380 [Sphingomonas solaris]